MELFDHPYARFLHAVEKPTRYTGAEHGARAKDWASVRARVCLAFPEIYDLGMSHLGFRILYKILNDDPRTLAERCYAPWVDMQRELRSHGELLRSLESARPLADFDVVGFSLQYELTYTNVLMMLELGGIPLRSASRSDDDPLVVAGGPVATHAEPMALFFDALLIGDGEEATTELTLAWAEAKAEGLTRRERLERLARISGVYVPSLAKTHLDPETGLEVVDGVRIERRVLGDLDRFPFPDDGPVGGPEAIFDRMSIEVARGCTEGCRFCQSGWTYRPVRERDPKQVVETVLSALEKSGYDEVSLTALSTADVSCISPLIKTLVEKTAPERVSLGVASLRAYGLGEELLDAMRTVRASGLTFAPEAGTQRMRDVINKNVTEAQLLETAERVFSRGFDKMKLYFIAGLPTETDEDVLGIVEVAKKTVAVGHRLGRRPRVTVSVSVHVPKPHTPFQWCAMDPLDEINQKQELLRRATRGVKGLELRMHHSLSSALEGILARGDRRLGPVIERAFLRGARSDSWDEHLDMDAWQEALEHFEIDISAYLGTLPVTARLPWDHIDVGIEDGFLAREYRKALASRLSPPCSKVAGTFVHHTNLADADADRRRLVCYDCGIACDMTRTRERRLGFLKEMGALEPTLPRVTPAQPVEGAAAPGEAERAPRRRVNPEALRPVRAGGTPARFRLRFKKIGPAALLGHLDLLRELPRVIRRAGVRIDYSRGFRPKPELSFGPALSLGIASLDEHADVKLIDAPEDLLERLNRSTSGGLEFIEARRLTDGEPGLSRIITGARYVIALAETALPGRAWLEERVATFLAKDELRVRREIRGLGKLVDVRSYVLALTVGGEPELRLLREAGLVGRMLPLDVSVRIGATGAVKVSELVEAVTGAPDTPHQAVRAALFGEGSVPLASLAERDERERAEVERARAAAP
ncbi:MAG: TIGR03960 family B12-binding radical SAM protein [Sorangiineae bacterium]|nr:TIGR03960 family B12-binding radical SAM protein [Sorangiineae bacterium]